MTIELGRPVVVAIGPVDPGAALTWTGHELANVARLRLHGDAIPFQVPDDVLDDIEVYLRAWRDAAVSAAAEGRPFRWSTEVPSSRLRLLVRYWANLDLLTDDMVERAELAWAPLSTRPFFDSLVAAVDRALRAAATDGAPDPFARLLAR